MTAIDDLLAIASPPLGADDATPSTGHDHLDALLGRKNGFYAFESALHVFPTGPSAVTSLEEWNAASLWRHEYGDLASGLTFFAEDAFGVQFALDGDAVWTFDPETGARERFEPTVESWAAALLADYESTTGHALAHAWQVANGPLPLDHRLVPRQLFVLGGAYEVENLANLPAAQGMGFRGSIARQIADLPDGAQIRLVVD